MCGIAGIYGPNVGRAASDATLKSMLQLIRHRGPDEAGMYLSDRLCMGTVRLSIVGISTGQQPLTDDEERYFLCYNGEVYNYIELREELRALGYRFSTESDTEVVLNGWRAWGPRCLERFNGGFAFALYDRVEDALHLVRDRFGKRPLFYAKAGMDVLFASEMKSFLADRNFQFQFDLQQLASILTLWTPIAGQSGFKGVQQVPLGSYVKVSGSQLSVTRYFELDGQARYTVRSEAEAVEAIDATLRHSLALRLRSDVEVGMYLSGGLDSSILASLLSEQVRDRFRTYALTFADGEFDEAADQLRIVSHAGSRHTALHVTDDMIARHFPETVFHAETPLFRTAPVPMYLLSRLVRDDGIKVVISGEGADEAFLGYDLFKETLLRSDWHGLNEQQRLARLRLLYPYLKHYSRPDAVLLLGLYEQFSIERHAGLFSHEIRIQNGLFSQRLLRDRGDGLDAIQRLMGEQSGFAQFSAIEKAQWLEFQSVLPGYILSSQGDRMALAHSVENRCPYLDPAVVELAMAANLRFDDGTDEKYLLRQAFATKLPPENLRKRKRPYRAPDSKVFVQHRPEYLELLLSDDQLRRIEILDTQFCKRLVTKVLTTPPEKISTKENQAFVFLVSIALLDHQLVRRNVSGVATQPPVDGQLVKIVERRQA